MPVAPSVPSRQRWLAPMLVVVCALTVSGGLLAREWYAAGENGEKGTVAVSTPASVPAHRQPGPRKVELTPGAAAHPRGEEIGALLQRHFDAINERDYQLWRRTVTARWAREKPTQEWRAAYRTTADGSILLYRIEAVAGPRLRILVAFTSTQAAKDAPVALPVGCIRWHLAMPAVRVEGDWKLDKVPSDTTPEFSRCDQNA